MLIFLFGVAVGVAMVILPLLALPRKEAYTCKIDAHEGVAYIDLAPKRGDRSAMHRQVVKIQCFDHQWPPQVIMDFDADKRLVGIEVLDTSLLPPT